MELVEFAERELKEAGWFDDTENGMYYGMIGPAVLELMQVFAAQGHSGGSAQLVVGMFTKLASFHPIMPLQNPMEKGEYIDRTEISNGLMFQSTRKSSVFSKDGGKSWYDIDKRIPKWKRLFGVRRAYLKF